MLGADDLHQQIAREVEPGDQHHHQPDLVGIDDIEWWRPEVLTGYEWQDDDADDRELEGCLDVRALDAALRAGAATASAQGCSPLVTASPAAVPDVATHAQQAEQEREQRGHLSRDAVSPRWAVTA